MVDSHHFQQENDVLLLVMGEGDFQNKLLFSLVFISTRLLFSHIFLRIRIRTISFIILNTGLQKKILHMKGTEKFPMEEEDGQS